MPPTPDSPWEGAVFSEAVAISGPPEPTPAPTSAPSPITPDSPGADRPPWAATCWAMASSESSWPPADAAARPAPLAMAALPSPSRIGFPAES